ncbi:MAG TPA: hypothetical protein VIY47_09490, partial [Ignavibacteriaceae bacterium]
PPAPAPAPEIVHGKVHYQAWSIYKTKIYYSFADVFTVSDSEEEEEEEQRLPGPEVIELSGGEEEEEEPIRRI